MKEQDYEQLTLFPAGSHVSHSAKPGSEAARKMTVTSGLKCFESYQNSDLLGCLVKMCLESSIWHSTRCYLTWKTSATPGKRLMFRLAVSMPRTEESESQFWPTPMASSWGGTGHRKTLKALRDKGLITEQERLSLQKGNQIDTNPGFLEWLMGYEQQFTKLIPTPTQTDYKGGISTRYWVPGSQSVQVERERDGARIRWAAQKSCGSHSAWDNWPDEPGVGRVADGVPNRMDRIKCLGNAVVPQQFYPFFSFIAEIEQKTERK